MNAEEEKEGAARDTAVADTTKKEQKEKKEKKKKSKGESDTEGGTSADESGAEVGGEGGKKKKKKKKKKKGDAIEEDEENEEDEEAKAAAAKAAALLAELEAAEAEPEPETVEVLIRPIDDGWAMGPDLSVTMLLDETVKMLKQRISEMKPHISPHRLVLIDPLKQVVEQNREANTFRRLALKEKSVYTIEPTIPGSWLWEDKQWYEDKITAEIYTKLDASTSGQVTVSDLEKSIIKPPHMKMSMKVFCRRFPDKLHLVMDTNKNECWVMRPPSTEKVLYQMPTFTAYTPLLGAVHHHKPNPAYDWEASADINDTKRVELDFDIPDIGYEISILSAANIKRADTFGSSDPQCIVFFYNGIEDVELGRTVCKRNTLFPEWRDERFYLAINASIEVENCKLLVEMWDCDIGPNGKDIPGDFLGAVELTGLDIVELIADGKTHEMTYDLKTRPESAPHDDQEDISGTLLLKGGKAGFEVNVVSCRQLVDLPNRTSQVFCIVIFNGDEILETLLNNDKKDPAFMENVNVPFSEMSLKLEDCIMEFQIWSTVGKGEGDKDPDSKGIFMGSVEFTGDDLVSFLKGNAPYATSVRRALKTSKNIPLNQRKNKTEGYITVIGGPSGLPMQPGKKYDIKLRFAERLSKVMRAYIEMEWNFVKTYSGVHTPIRVELGKCIFEQSFRVETDGGADNVLGCSLRLDLWEDISQAFGNVEQNYLGHIFLEGEELAELMDGKYAHEMSFDWQPDDAKPGKIQRLVRGSCTVRGGALGNRLEDERAFYILSAKNLGRANTGAMLGLGSSDPFVEVKLNDEILYTTPAIEANLNPVWAEQLVYVKIPELREFTEKELKAWLKNNDALVAAGEKPANRSIYHESVLEIGVYDETDGGGKGACLGVVRLEEADMVAFFDCKEPHEQSFPLVKDSRKENMNSATRNPTLGTDSEIKLSTTGKKYISPLKWRADVEAAIQAEQARLREEEEERIALELAKLEAERQKQEDAERREAEREAEIAAKKKQLEEDAAKALLEKEEAEEAVKVAAQSEDDAASAQQAAEEEAKRAADREAYEEMMELADD